MSLFSCFNAHRKKNITVGFTNIQWNSLITMGIVLHLWKHICQVKYTVLMHLALNIFFVYSPLHRLPLKMLLTIFLWVIQCLSQIHSHFYHVLFLPTSIYNQSPSGEEPLYTLMRTLKIFVKKSIELHSDACQLLQTKVHVAFFFRF